MFWGLLSQIRLKTLSWFIIYLEWGWASLIRWVCFLFFFIFSTSDSEITSLNTDIIRWLKENYYRGGKKHKYCHLSPSSGDSKPMYRVSACTTPYHVSFVEGVRKGLHFTLAFVTVCIHLTIVSFISTKLIHITARLRWVKVRREMHEGSFVLTVSDSSRHLEKNPHNIMLETELRPPQCAWRVSNLGQRMH